MRIVLTLLSCLAVFAIGEANKRQAAHCKCAGFVTVPEGEADVLDLPPIPVDACTELLRCKDLCIAEWELHTVGGNLCAEGGKVGEEMCQDLHAEGISNLEPSHVFLYYKICDEPWNYDGVKTEHELECSDGMLTTPC